MPAGSGPANPNGWNAHDGQEENSPEQAELQPASASGQSSAGSRVAALSTVARALTRGLSSLVVRKDWLDIDSIEWKPADASSLA